MKKLLLLLLLVCSMSAWAQDVIVKKDGSTIVCRVVEVNQTEVVYKRWSNLEGPNYIMNLADVSAINYENGEKDRTNDSKDSVLLPTPILQSNNTTQTVSDDILLEMAKKQVTPTSKKAKRLKIIGWVGGSTLIATGAIIMGAVYDDRVTDRDHSVGHPVGGSLIGIGAIWTTSFLIRSYNLNKKAQQYTVFTSPLYENEFKLKNGASLATGVDLLKDNKHNNPTLGLGLRYNF